MGSVLLLSGMEDDIRRYLEEKCYASLNAIWNHLNERGCGISSRALNQELREMCALPTARIGRLSEDVAAEAVLQSNTYYWKPWLDSHDRSPYESEGDIIALAILAHMRAKYPELTYEVGPLPPIPFSCYKNLVAYSYPERYQLQKFVGRYFTWLVKPRREYLKGLEAERGGNLQDALTCYQMAADAGYCKAQYRLVKLQTGRGDVFSAEDYKRMLSILHEARLVYVPAACLYADLCERLGRNDEAKEMLMSLSAVGFRSEWDDEVALCLAKDLHRRNQHEQKALELCQWAAEHGNPEAEALITEWNNLHDTDDLLLGALNL